MGRFVFLCTILLCCPCLCPGAGLDPGEYPTLERYIGLGLERNLALRRSGLSYRQSLERAREARGGLMPSVDFSTRYSRAGGGRMIDIPIGEMVNPIYSTLNELLAVNRFPADLANGQVPFLREKEHETGFRVTQQIFNPMVRHNYKAAGCLAEAGRNDLAAFRRRLVNEIETSYFTCLKVWKVVEHYEQSLALLEENLRVSRRLFAAEKVTKDAIYRAETRYHRLDQQREAVLNESRLARSRFNFLLDRPLEEQVLRDSVPLIREAPALDMNALKALALEHREEVLSIESALRAAGHSVKAAKSGFIPSLALVADYGFQGESYSFTGHDDYWRVSGVFQWNLFSGFSDKSRVSRAGLEVNKLEQALAEFRNRICLEVEQCVNNVNSAYRVLDVSRLAVRSAGENFRMVARKYEEGLVPQIEYMDAQTAMTRARIEKTMALYDYLIQLSGLKLTVADAGINLKQTPGGI